MNATIGMGLLLLALGCSKGERAPGSTPAATPASAPVAPVGGGTVLGEVKFVGTAPANPPIDMSEEPKCKADYSTTPREQVVVVNPNGTLADVFVYVKSGLPAGVTYPTPATPVVIGQKGGMYHPRVWGETAGEAR